MTTTRPWLDDAARAALARQFDCPIDEVDDRLDARAAMEQQIAERREYEDPYGYELWRMGQPEDVRICFFFDN